MEVTSEQLLLVNVPVVIYVLVHNCDCGECNVGTLARFTRVLSCVTVPPSWFESFHSNAFQIT